MLSNVRVKGNVTVSKCSMRLFVFSPDTNSVGIWKDISSAGPELTQQAALTFTTRLQDRDSVFICVGRVCGDWSHLFVHVCLSLPECVLRKLVEPGASLPWMSCSCTNEI